MSPKTDDFEEKVRASYARQSMMVTLGARLGNVCPGAVEIHAPIDAGVLQQAGYAHGGFLFSIGDSAAGYSALSLQDQNSEVLTIEMKVNFLAPARGIEAIARGRVIRAGRRVVTVASDVFTTNEEGGEKHVAALQGTMMVVPA